MGKLNGNGSVDKAGNGHGHRHGKKTAQPRIPGKITIQRRHLGQTTRHQHNDAHPGIRGQPAATHGFRRQRVDTGDQQDVKQKDIEGIDPETFHGFPALIVTVFGFQAPGKA